METEFDKVTKKHIKVLQDLDDDIAVQRHTLVQMARGEVSENSEDIYFSLKALKGKLEKYVKEIEKVLN